MHDHLYEQPIDDRTMLRVLILDSGHQRVVFNHDLKGLTSVGSREELIDVAVGMTVDDPGENIGLGGERINILQLTGLCRPPNYAESGRFFPRFLADRRFGRFGIVGSVPPLSTPYSPGEYRGIAEPAVFKGVEESLGP